MEHSKILRWFLLGDARRCSRRQKSRREFFENHRWIKPQRLDEAQKGNNIIFLFFFRKLCPLSCHLHRHELSVKTCQPFLGEKRDCPPAGSRREILAIASLLAVGRLFHGASQPLRPLHCSKASGKTPNNGTGRRFQVPTWNAIQGSHFRPFCLCYRWNICSPINLASVSLLLFRGFHVCLVFWGFSFAF